MADISITAANCVTVGGTFERGYVAGETITAGQYVYLKSSNSKWMKAQSDGTTEESGYNVLTGIALNGASAGQPIVVQLSGTVTVGGTLTAGTVYYVSNTAGGIAPFADLSSTNKSAIIGMGASSTVLDLTPKFSGGIVI